MAGTKEGGQRAAQTNKERYGEDFYVKIGAKSAEGWEKNGRKPRGFALWKEQGKDDLIVKAGSKGGTISRRRAKQVQS